MAVHFAASIGLCYLIMRFFFPYVFLLAVVTVVAALATGCCAAPFRVVLDHSGGELVITTLWTEHVPLARLASVRELPFGFKITTAESGYEIGGGRYFRLLKRLLRIRTGFEGMEQAVGQAVAADRAASPAGVYPGDAASRPGILLASLFCCAGLFALTVAVAVQPQTGAWLVRALAWLVRVYFGAGGFVITLAGVWLLHSALRDRRSVR